MPSYGTVQRAKPRVTVLRGYSPNAPHSKTQAVQVNAATTILSGQVISQQWNAGESVYEWILGCASGTPYIALQDSADYDVVSANSLVGLSLFGDFEIQTGYFTSGSYPVDTPLAADTAGNVGNVVPTTVGSGTAIIGWVTRNNAPVNLAAPGPTGYPQDSSATNENVISFQTGYQINPS